MPLWPILTVSGHGQGGLSHTASSVFTDHVLSTVPTHTQRVYRSAGRDLEHHASRYTCGFHSKEPKEREKTKNKQEKTNRKEMAKKVKKVEKGKTEENGGKRGKWKRTTFASSSVWKRGTCDIVVVSENDGKWSVPRFQVELSLVGVSKCSIVEGQGCRIQGLLIWACAVCLLVGRDGVGRDGMASPWS